MNMVIIFEKISLKEISDLQVFKEKFIDAAITLTKIKDDAKTDIKLLEGTLPNTPEKEKVLIILSSDQPMPNMGRKIVEFKKDVLKVFEGVGIPLDKDSLTVKMNSPYDVEAFIRELKKNEIPKSSQPEDNNEFDYEQKSKQYIPVEPSYSFERVILNEDVLEKIEEAVGVLECENKVFKEWGLYEIQPHPSTSLSFYGPSGTGKTMAAEAVAQKLGKKILKVSYADVESKYHGEGPKMVKAIFLAAEKNDAVLFFDEADSLLSKRLTSVSQGSEQAINSMRSQLLICLEEFRGIVIFATNLVINYDQAFLTRLISVEFKKPDVETRKRIWDVHIKPLPDGKTHQLNIPLSENVDTQELAEKYDFSGRDIRNAVVSACVSVAMAKREIVEQADFLKSSDKIAEEKKALLKAKDYTKGEDLIKKALQDKIKKSGGKQNVSEQSE